MCCELVGVQVFKRQVKHYFQSVQSVMETEIPLYSRVEEICNSVHTPLFL